MAHIIVYVMLASALVVVNKARILIMINSKFHTSDKEGRVHFLERCLSYVRASAARGGVV